jgi:hypothetical protein
MPPRLVIFLTRLARVLRSRKGAALLITFTVALAAFIFFQRRDTQPSYQGSPAGEWLAQASTNAQRMPEAIVAFRAMGQEGARFLGQTLIHKPSRTQQWLLARHHQIPGTLKPLLFKPAPQPNNRTILHLLLALGRDAAPAIPDLMTWLEGNSSSYSPQTLTLPYPVVSLTTNRAGGSSQSLLMISATSSNRMHAFLLPPGGILSIQTQTVISAPGQVVTNIILSATSVSNTIPSAAHHLLQDLGSTDPRIIALLLRPVERSPQSNLSPEFGPQLREAARQSLPLLAQRSKSLNAEERLTALALLKLTLPESQAAREQFIRALGDQEYTVFNFAIGTLSGSTNDLNRIVPLALAGLHLNKTIGSQPFTGPDHLPSALRAFSQHTPLVVAGLQEALTVNPFNGQADVLKLLADLGTTNNVRLELIGSFTNHTDTLVRASAWHALGKLTGDPQALVNERLSLMRQTTDANLWQSYTQLGELGPDAWRAVPLLCEGLKHWNERIVAKAAETLGRIGPAARAALPELEAQRHHPHLVVREAVEQAIRSINDTARAKRF